VTSALWRQTGGIWPMGVSCSLTWYDVGAILHVVQSARIRTVLEVGVEHGGLASLLRAYGGYTGLVYRGIDITLAPLHTVVRERDASAIDQRDAWDAATVVEMGQWLGENPAPALIICDGGDKPRELHLYAPLLRDGDVMLGHDYHNEYGDDAIRTVPAQQVRTDWLDDTLLCMFVRGEP
jgi:cephalosporin hydroxylase